MEEDKCYATTNCSEEKCYSEKVNQPRLEILVELEKMEEKNKTLLDLMAKLEERISPVLSEPIECSEVEAVGEREKSTVIGRRIASTRKDTETMIVMIGDMFNRIEL